MLYNVWPNTRIRMCSSPHVLGKCSSLPRRHLTLFGPTCAGNTGNCLVPNAVAPLLPTRLRGVEPIQQSDPMTVHDDLLADLTSAKLIRSNSPTLSFVLFLQPLPLPPLPLLPPLSLLRSTRTPSVAPLPCFTLPTRSALSSLSSALSSLAPPSPHPPLPTLLPKVAWTWS